MLYFSFRLALFTIAASLLIYTLYLRMALMGLETRIQPQRWGLLPIFILGAAEGFAPSVFWL